MSKYIAWVLVLAMFTGAGQAMASSSQVDNFRFYSEIELSKEIVVPTVVEVPVSGEGGTSAQDFLVFNQSDVAVVPHHFMRVTKDNSVDFIVTNKDGLLSALSDKVPGTSQHFPLINGGETVTVLNIEANEQINSSGIRLSLDSNVIAPKFVKVIKIDDVNGEEVLYAGAMEANISGVRFPETKASLWRLELTHTQPLRLTGITLMQNLPPAPASYFVRFLAQPNTSYLLYTSSNGTKDYKSAPELSRVERTVLATLNSKTPNPTFTELDTDSDGVIDRLDNCRTVPNGDQVDLDKSGVGDVCEDFDIDNVFNSNDNCPNIPNQNQRDSDGDNIGDACDEEESRLTEKYPWISWIGLALAMLMIGSMFLLVRREADAIEKNDVA